MSMEVLIVSKTRMGSLACVGGLVLTSGRHVRLMEPGNWNQPGDTPLEVGDIWDIHFTARGDVAPPHVEDVIVHSKRHVRSIGSMTDFLVKNDAIGFRGSIDGLFNGCIRFTNSGTGYIPEQGPLPASSVGFWVADRDLIKSEYEGKLKYRYSPYPDVKSLSYVGYGQPVEQIPAGTILRVSLSRIFAPPVNSKAPKGFYLQLSGWYDLPNAPALKDQKGEDDFLDDLPF